MDGGGRSHRRTSPILAWTHPSVERQSSVNSPSLVPNMFSGEGPAALDAAPGIKDSKGLSVPPARLGVAAVVAMAFFNVSGGPWGSEDIFSSCNPFVGCIGIVVFTVFFSLPQVLVTSELGCALPSNGGYAVWIREAFGDFWAFNVTYWQWVSGVADAAVYPVLICDTVLALLGRTEIGSLEKWLWRVVTTGMLSLPTFVSISSVPSLLVSMAITTGAPVVVFIVIGARFVNPAVWMQTKAGVPVRLGKMINVLFWNMEGWDCVSTCSAMCEEPIEKTMPRGLFIALAITSLQYLLVLLIAAGISEDTIPWQHWSDGTLPSIGASLGFGMAGLLLASSIVGNAGQYLSEFLENSFLLQGAADLGIVPRVLAWQLPSGVPITANLLQLGIVLLTLTFDFSDILVFDNFFCAVSISLEFVAFFRLRRSQPALKRPFLVSSFWFVLFPPAAVVLCVVVYHCLTKSWYTFSINMLALALGLPYAYWVARQSRREHEDGHRSGFDILLEDAPS